MLTISSSTISGNYAKAGGGIGNVYYSVTLSNSTISGNSAYSGGGIVSYGGSVTLSNSTISGNSAYVLDGGINNTDLGTLHTRNTIVAGNMAPSSPDLHGNLGSLGHNLIGNTQGGSGFDPTDLLNVDPLLGPLQDNGGPTQTLALLPGSPAIDAGDNTDAPCWDQRREGFPRIVGIIDPDNPVIDIGAFEVQDAGGSQGRSSRLGLRPVSFAAAALVGMQSLPPMSHSPRAAKPLEGAVDALFATNNTATRPAVTVGRPAVTDPFSPFHKHEESRQDLTQDDVFDWFGRLFL
jgi:hypothetical protein